MAERGRPKKRNHEQGRVEEEEIPRRRLSQISINQDNDQPIIDDGWKTVSHKRVIKSQSMGSSTDSGLNTTWSGSLNRGRSCSSKGSSRRSITGSSRGSSHWRSSSNDSIGSSSDYVDVDLHGIKVPRDMKKSVKEGIFRKCFKREFKVYIEAGAPKGENNMRKQVMEYLEELQKTGPVCSEETGVWFQVRNFELYRDAVGRKERRQKGRTGNNWDNCTVIIVNMRRLYRRGSSRKRDLQLSDFITSTGIQSRSSIIIPRSTSSSSLSSTTSNYLSEYPSIMETIKMRDQYYGTHENTLKPVCGDENLSRSSIIIPRFSSSSNLSSTTSNYLSEYPSIRETIKAREQFYGTHQNTLKHVYGDEQLDAPTSPSLSLDPVDPGRTSSTVPTSGESQDAIQYVRISRKRIKGKKRKLEISMVGDIKETHSTVLRKLFCWLCFMVVIIMLYYVF